MIKTNPTVLIDMPKIHEKAIIRLDADEVARLLDYIEHCGDQLTGQKKAYYEKTKERDLAIVTLLLGTGVRVSECVGLDVEDVDFNNNAIKVTRKGGNEMFVYFGPEVEKALKQYLPVREGITPVPGHEHALFYSTREKKNRRTGRGKPGEEICQGNHHHEKNYPPQASKHLRHRSVSGNRGYLPGGRRSGT